MGRGGGIRHRRSGGLADPLVEKERFWKGGISHVKGMFRAAVGVLSK